MLTSSVSSASWASTLCRCFAFERSAAALLLYNTSQAGPHAALTPQRRPPDPRPTAASMSDEAQADSLRQPTCNSPMAAATCLADPPPVITSSCRGTASPPDTAASPPPTAVPASAPAPAQTHGQGEGTPQARGASRHGVTTSSAEASRQAQLATVLLPRMQMGLVHITAPATYVAVASAARTLARATLPLALGDCPSPGTADGAPVVTDHKHNPVMPVALF